MKTIEPIQIWIDGENTNGVIFDLNCVYDNLVDAATFSFFLKDANLNNLANSNITMTMPDYLTDWVDNNAAYNWAATQLGLTITGEYIPVD